MIRLIVLVLTVSVLTYAECPASCKCTETSLLCIDKGLENVPNFDYLDASPLIVDLSGNKLISVDVDDFSFDKNDEIKEIYLNNSEIVDIASDAFEELDSLQELYLGQNLLNDVSEFIIEPLENMLVLDLSNNYFAGDMPKIRSKSLEVLAVANAKISDVPENALAHLPNLKLLLLQQNNIKTLTYDAFKTFEPNSFFMKLSYNPWECSCDNLMVFKLLARENFIDVAEPYQCLNDESVFVDIFGNKGLSNCRDVRAMVDEDLDEERYYSTTPKPYGDEKELECSGLYLVKFIPDNEYFLVVLIALTASFFFGLVAGMLLCKLTYVVRFRNLEQGTSDSTTKLIIP